MVPDSRSRMFPFPLLSAMQEYRPHRNRIRFRETDAEPNATNDVMSYPAIFSDSALRIEFSVSATLFRLRTALCRSRCPSRHSESHYAGSRSPGATACQPTTKERSEQCLSFFGHTATGSPAGRKNSNGTRSCAPTSAHCSSLKFTPHKTGGSSFADNTSGIATA